MRIHNIVGALRSHWVIFSIIIWCFLVLTAVVVLNLYMKNEALGIQIVELNQEIEMLTENKIYIENEKENFNFGDKQLSLVLSELLSASKKSGASLGETQIAEVIEHDDYNALPITVLVKGNFNQIGKFVNTLEKNIQIKVVDVNLSTKETKGSGIIGKIKAEFVII